MVRELHEFFPNSAMICGPCGMTVNYWSSDLKRRDVSAMLDSVFSILEKAMLVKDDSLIQNVVWRHMGYDKKNGRAEVTVESL